MARTENEFCIYQRNNSTLLSFELIDRVIKKKKEKKERENTKTTRVHSTPLKY